MLSRLQVEQTILKDAPKILALKKPSAPRLGRTNKLTFKGQTAESAESKLDAS